MKARYVVTLILSATAICALAGFLYMRSDAYCVRDANCRQLYRVEQWLHLYVLEKGSVPTRLEDLLSLNDPRYVAIIRSSDFVDAWGHRITYTPNTIGLLSFRLAILAAHKQADGQGPTVDVLRDWHL